MITNPVNLTLDLEAGNCLGRNANNNFHRLTTSINRTTGIHEKSRYSVENSRHNSQVGQNLLNERDLRENTPPAAFVKYGKRAYYWNNW